MTPLKKYGIDIQGLTPGKHHVEFDVSDDLFMMYEESEVKKGQLRVEIDIDKHSSMLELNVDIVGEVEVECDRCLDPLSVPVQYDGRLIVKISADQGEYDGDIMWLYPSDDELNLSQYIYESVILSLPYQRIHRTIEECNPEMVKRLTIVDEEL